MVFVASVPHATRVCDPRAAGLIQVKAVGLVVVSDHNLPLTFYRVNRFHCFHLCVDFHVGCKIVERHIYCEKSENGEKTKTKAVEL